MQGANGALTGTILLNGQFTEKAMEGQSEGEPCGRAYCEPLCVQARRCQQELSAAGGQG